MITNDRSKIGSMRPPRLLVFFFQAEDGIRDYKVTGVQTCALPISPTVTGFSGAKVMCSSETIITMPPPSTSGLPWSMPSALRPQLATAYPEAEVEDRKSVV